MPLHSAQTSLYRLRPSIYPIAQLVNVLCHAPVFFTQRSVNDANEPRNRDNYEAPKPTACFGVHNSPQQSLDDVEDELNFVRRAAVM
jgi:hypothetical protein